MIDLDTFIGGSPTRLEIPNSDWMVSDVVRRIGEPPRRPASVAPRLAGALVALVVVAIVALPGRGTPWPDGSVSTMCVSNHRSQCRRHTTSTPPSAAQSVPAGTVVEPTTLPVPDLGLEAITVHRESHLRDRPARSDPVAPRGFTISPCRAAARDRSDRSGLSAVKPRGGVPSDRCGSARLGDASSHRGGILPEDARQRLSVPPASTATSVTGSKDRRTH